MSDKWTRPTQAPPPLFVGDKEKDLVKQINDEIIERVVGQQILYFSIDLETTDFHPVYGEAMEKNFYHPIRVFALVEFQGVETEFMDNFTLDKKTKLKVFFHKRRLTEAILRHIDEKFNLFVQTAAGREKVPVIWQTAERTFQIKNSLESRDTTGKLILPLIAVTRDSIEKDPSFRGKVQAHIFEDNTDQGGALLVSRKILQKETTKYQVAKNLRGPRGDKFYPVASGKVLYQETYMPVPVYVKVMYTVNLRTEYIQQMNELMSPFLAKTGQIWSFTVVHENHRYETFIEQVIDDKKNSSNLGEEERKFEAQIKLKVLGYLTHEGENRSRPYNGVRETTVDLVLRERIVSEIPKKGSTSSNIPNITEAITTIGMELYTSSFLEEVTIDPNEEDED